jgi:hypothetical protein
VEAADGHTDAKVADGVYRDVCEHGRVQLLIQGGHVQGEVVGHEERLVDPQALYDYLDGKEAGDEPEVWEERVMVLRRCMRQS